MARALLTEVVFFLKRHTIALVLELANFFPIIIQAKLRY